jgi:hypothetical protein
MIWNGAFMADLTIPSQNSHGQSEQHRQNSQLEQLLGDY